MSWITSVNIISVFWCSVLLKICTLPKVLQEHGAATITQAIVNKPAPSSALVGSRHCKQLEKNNGMYLLYSNVYA